MFAMRNRKPSEVTCLISLQHLMGHFVLLRGCQRRRCLMTGNDLLVPPFHQQATISHSFFSHQAFGRRVIKSMQRFSDAEKRKAGEKQLTSSRAYQVRPEERKRGVHFIIYLFRRELLCVVRGDERQMGSSLT